MEGLPADCIADILSRGTPRDACRSAVVASLFRTAVESDMLWDSFLPPDHQEIISKSMSPVMYKSKKELFFKLSSPIFIDRGLKAFSIDKATGKNVTPFNKNVTLLGPLILSFGVGNPLTNLELRMTSWLEVEGKINTRILSPNTMYRAYLIVQVAHYRAFGFDVVPCEISVEVCEFCSRGVVTLSHSAFTKRSLEHVCGKNKVGGRLRLRSDDKVSRVCLERKDGWLEIELGEFYNQGMCEKEVKMSLREIKGVHLKGGLIVKSLEIRPVSP
ncbi:hypothetical protein M8C21_015717 [Ambrosia artemisiifolia]|uniref:F-box domain-containing protein n=1 Tax=Ambrosia artemisiifolia TaxID=4212 RepID=A0AAD5C072_AMBAR|nr:hypothetical protein M8C21_015717 [Ambrosia artemisiifolia]